MTIRRTVALTAITLLGGALLTACATTTPRPASHRPYAADDLVLRIRVGDGFVPILYHLTELPMISVYGDGRVLTVAPVPAIYPGPALPNLQLQHITDAGINRLVDQALDAGVGSGADLGQPNVMDAPSTYFSVLAEDGTSGPMTVHTTAVNALGLGGGGNGLSRSQQQARATLNDLVSDVTDLKRTLGSDVLDEPAAYSPAALAAFAGAYNDPGSPGLPTPADVTWPGPALPGSSVRPQSGYGCVMVTGEALAPVLAAATKANALTPWSADSERWSIGFRPLLPDEKDCAGINR